MSLIAYSVFFLLAGTLLRRALEAVEQRGEQVAAFIQFDASLPEESTAQWTVMVKAWELDGTKPNPFDFTERRKFILPFAELTRLIMSI